LIGDPEVDVVSIATPPLSHCDLALQVCAAGKPALVEKPMATHHAECLRMVDAFRTAGLPLFVAYYRRALPRFLKVKELLDDGAIGDVRSVTLRMMKPLGSYDPENLPWRVIPEIAGGGYFVDIGSHTLDLVDYLVAPVATARGVAGNQGSPYPAEDSVALAFQLENGVVGTGLWQFDAPAHRDEFEINGTRGTLQFATFADQPVRLITRDGELEFNIPNPAAVQQPLIQTIVNQLSGESLPGEPPGRESLCPSTGETAARTTKVMEEVLAEYYRAGRASSL
ncbi:MAG: Gfo/Idh/MocA family oxidoreductase, partial [Chloroflexi bacterium]|nr:Gfo/Idh/MocA family oxidoreductase [Chloroflexota bacterium]